MNMELDSPTPVRAGEELCGEKLEPYLREHLPEFTGPLNIEQFPHGHSNLTYLLRRGSRELVLRRPPFGNQVQTAHDMSREYRVLSKLSNVYPLAPRPYLFCDDISVLGAPFYVMERRRGVVLRKAVTPGLALWSDAMRGLSIALIDNLAKLHAIDYQTAGLGELGKPVGYVARQVIGWTTRYSNARTNNVASMDHVAAWLGANMPAESGASIIHNDYKFDNLVLDPADLSHIVAVLDWEMATLGDPLMDLGTTLGYWVQADDPEPLRAARLGPTTLPGCLTRRELVERYVVASGRPIANPLFYYIYGLFKVAVIIQQIYARFVRGHTRDPRFGQLNDVVEVLAQQAERAIGRGNI
jgi:aminoglycoside phosphotransferase (APT) family kinase protein